MVIVITITGMLMMITIIAMVIIDFIGGPGRALTKNGDSNANIDNNKDNMVVMTKRMMMMLLMMMTVTISY